ncbi:MAG: hypothetical protein LBJ23_04325 [Tannerella sp.]|nr:hypothetical protein [Tannerella sp.]
MKQTQKPKKAFLYSGLGILLAAFAAGRTGMPAYVFWILLGAAVTLKTLFLISVFRVKGFRPALWLYLILTGVALILVALLFRTVFHAPALYGILFYSAVSLKVAGLILMLYSGIRKTSR